MSDTEIAIAFVMVIGMIVLLFSMMVNESGVTEKNRKAINAQAEIILELQAYHQARGKIHALAEAVEQEVHAAQLREVEAVFDATLAAVRSGQRVGFTPPPGSRRSPSPTPKP